MPRALLEQTSLTIFTGPMFSAKTERLIAEIRRYQYADCRVLVLKPGVDTRTTTAIASRRITDMGTSENVHELPAHTIHTREDFISVVREHEFDVLAVDEVQFFPLDTPFQDTLGWFGREIRELLNTYRNESLQIVLAGLDTDSADRPFGPVPGLLALADRVEKLAAVCMACGHIHARKSQSLVGTAMVRVGNISEYQARCRRCFDPQ